MCQCILFLHYSNKPKSLRLLFPHKLLCHRGSHEESVGTKRQNVIFFHLSLPLLLSLYLSASVFPRSDNWHSSLSHGKKLIYILSHKHTLILGLSAQTPKKADESSPSSFFPEKPPFTPAAALSGWPSTFAVLGKNTYLSHNSPPKVHSGINPSRPWLLEVPDRSS